jgi:hypothetical protein
MAEYKTSEWKVAPSYVGQAQNNGLLAYVHIPKCAGTTLNIILGTIAATHNKDNFIIHGGVKYLCLKPYPLEVEEIHEDSHAFILGHFSYGIHKYFDRPIGYITVVREPIDRVISDLKHLELISENQISPDSLERKYDGVRKLPPALRAETSANADNLIVRMICGDVPLERFCNDEDLERAKKCAQDNFCLIGLAENFQLFLSCLLSQFGLSSIAYKPLRVSASEINITASLREKIALENSLDTALYNWIAENVAPKSEPIDCEKDKSVVWIPPPPFVK